MDTQRFESAGGSRYQFDFGQCHYKRGWAQCDTSQDASYFGIWTNPFRHMIVTYAEGDVTIQTAASEAEYRDAVRAMVDWYRDRGQWRGIDGMCHGQIISRMAALGLADLLH